jgi:hypothetical protein
VDRAVYSGPWYTYSQKYKKHLALVIMRAQRPVEITVGHYYSLSLQSCELVGSKTLAKKDNMLRQKNIYRVHVFVIETPTTTILHLHVLIFAMYCCILKLFIFIGLITS